MSDTKDEKKKKKLWNKSADMRFSAGETFSQIFPVSSTSVL